MWKCFVEYVAEQEPDTWHSYPIPRSHPHILLWLDLSLLSAVLSFSVRKICSQPRAGRPEVGLLQHADGNTLESCN